MTDKPTPATPAKIRVGLIGAGNWANHGHLRVLDLLPDYEVVAVQARRREAAEAAAKRYSIRHIVDTVEELVALPDVDLVLVLNTAPQHAATVRTVIAAGKDVYCEWPLTVNSDTARELAALARTAGVRHFVGLQRRLAPHNRYLRDLLADGYVGNLRSVRMHVSMNYFQALRSQALRWTAPPENFSSVIVIYAGHFLDMLFQAVGRPTEVSALLVNQFPEVTIAGSNEVIPTTNPDQLLLSARLACLMHPIGAVIVAIVGGAAASVFAIFYGAGNGVLTIARGTLPLAVFGPKDYAYRLGLIGAPSRMRKPWGSRSARGACARNPRACLRQWRS